MRRTAASIAGLALVLAGAVAAVTGGAVALVRRPHGASTDAGVRPSSPDAFDGSTESALTASAARLFDEAAPEAAAAVVGSLALQLGPRGGTDPGLRVSLDRVWSACKANPSGCETATRDFVARTVRTLRTRGEPAARDAVVAVLRPRAYLDRIGAFSGSTGAVIDPFVDDLSIVYMVDLQDSVRSLAATELDGLAIDRRQLPALAFTNLRPRLGRLADALASADSGSFNVLRSGNPLESSRLLMADEWDALASKAGRPIVVAAPASDVVLVAIGPTREQLATMRDTARGLFAAASRPVSPRLFRWTARTWAVVR
jgi:hypothetical protein